MKTDIKTKTLFYLLAVAIIVSIVLSYQRTVVRKDFETFYSEEEVEEENDFQAGEMDTNENINPTIKEIPADVSEL